MQNYKIPGIIFMLINLYPTIKNVIFTTKIETALKKLFDTIIRISDNNIRQSCRNKNKDTM